MQGSVSIHSNFHWEIPRNGSDFFDRRHFVHCECQQKWHQSRLFFHQISQGFKDSRNAAGLENLICDFKHVFVNNWDDSKN